MTNLPRLQLSAEVQEWLRLAPELVSHFKEVPQVNHEPPETFEGFTWFVVVCNPKCERRAQVREAGTARPPSCRVSDLPAPDQAVGRPCQEEAGTGVTLVPAVLVHRPHP